MKCKIIRATHEDMEKEINKWLNDENIDKIHHTSMSMVGDSPMFTILYTSNYHTSGD